MSLNTMQWWQKKVTHGRATIFKIVRNVWFTEKVFAIIGEMGSMLVWLFQQSVEI